jgi:hypothetical protein
MAVTCVASGPGAAVESAVSRPSSGHGCGVRIREGVALAEAVLALVVGACVVATAAAALNAALRGALDTSVRTEVIDAERTALAVMRADISFATPGDISFAGDSVRLRVFRALAIPCHAVDASITVRWRGARDPDPAKDSLLVIGGSDEPAFALTSAGTVTAVAPGCNPEHGDRLFRLTFPAPIRAGLLVAFETGSYQVVDGALRYRRGSSGRQPLTAEVFERESGFAWSAAALRVRLVSRRGPMGFRSTEARIALRHGATP